MAQSLDLNRYNSNFFTMLIQTIEDSNENLSFTRNNPAECMAIRMDFYGWRRALAYRLKSYTPLELEIQEIFHEQERLKKIHKFALQIKATIKDDTLTFEFVDLSPSEHVLWTDLVKAANERKDLLNPDLRIVMGIDELDI